MNKINISDLTKNKKIGNITICKNKELIQIIIDNQEADAKIQYKEIVAIRLSEIKVKNLEIKDCSINTLHFHNKGGLHLILDPKIEQDISNIKKSIENMDSKKKFNEIFPDSKDNDECNKDQDIEIDWKEDIEFNCTSITLTNCFLDKITSTCTEIKSKINFNSTIIQNDVSFKKITFNEKVVLSDIDFLGKLEFDRVVFKKKFELSTKSIFNLYSLLYSSLEYFWVFKIIKKWLHRNLHDIAVISFSKCTFKKNFSLKRSIIKNPIFFSSTTFEGSAYFDYTKFENYVSFLETRFVKRIFFYGATFEKPMNFTHCHHSEGFDLSGTQLKFSFKEVKGAINEECKRTNINNKTEVANMFRDWFRLFKHALSREGNVLETLDYHRAELYCREIEFKFKKPFVFSKEWIDKWQLYFFRKITDHHTDLLRTWNSLMCLIFIFSILSFGAMTWFAYYTNNDFSLWNLSNLQSLHTSYRDNIPSLLDKSSYRIFSINLGFIIMFLLLFWLSTLKFFRWIFIPCGYLASIVMFAISPKLLMPAIGFFTDKREILDPLSIIGGAYTLLFGLIAYSLIKTARKNSIIPS